MDVAVIGGTGAEGFGLTLRLAKAGHHVTIGSRSAEKGAASAADAREILGAGAAVDGTTNEEAAGIAGVIAVVVPFAGDQFFFFLGRYNGARILARFPAAQDRAHRFDAMLARWHAPLIVAIRFMYGFRILGPILLGMGRVPSWKFMLYNFVGAAIWAPLIAGLGYAFGSVVKAAIENLDQYEMWIFGALIGLGAGATAVHWMRRRHRAR